MVADVDDVDSWGGRIAGVAGGIVCDNQEDDDSLLGTDAGGVVDEDDDIGDEGSDLMLAQPLEWLCLKTHRNHTIIPSYRDE